MKAEKIYQANALNDRIKIIQDQIDRRKAMLEFMNDSLQDHSKRFQCQVQLLDLDRPWNKDYNPTYSGSQIVPVMSGCEAIGYSDFHQPSHEDNGFLDRLRLSVMAAFDAQITSDQVLVDALNQELEQL